MTDYMGQLAVTWDVCRDEGAEAIAKYSLTYMDFLFDTIYIQQRAVDSLRGQLNTALQQVPSEADRLQRLIDQDLADASIGFHKLMTNSTTR